MFFIETNKKLDLSISCCEDQRYNTYIFDNRTSRLYKQSSKSSKLCEKLETITQQIEIFKESFSTSVEISGNGFSNKPKFFQVSFNYLSITLLSEVFQYKRFTFLILFS